MGGGIVSKSSLEKTEDLVNLIVVTQKATGLKADCKPRLGVGNK